MRRAEERFPRMFGPYILLQRLGEGSHGTTYLARERTSRAPLVIKRLRDDVLDRADLRARLRHEAQIAVTVDNPRVVRALDVGLVGRVPYVAMELVDGWSMAAILRACYEGKLPWPIAAVIALIAEMLAGLDALHGAIDPANGLPLDAVHRDLSPQNVMVRVSGLPVLIDLGMGRSSLREWETATGSSSGTPGYMAPEQVLRRVVDHRADLYAVAVLAFELMTLERYIAPGNITRTLRATCDGAFRPPSSIDPAIPTALDAVMERALSVSAADRYPSAQAFREALVAVVTPAPELVPGCVPEALRQVLDVRRAGRLVLLSAPSPEGREGDTEHTIFARASRRAYTEVLAAGTQETNLDGTQVDHAHIEASATMRAPETSGVTVDAPSARMEQLVTSAPFVPDTQIMVDAPFVPETHALVEVAYRPQSPVFPALIGLAVIVTGVLAGLALVPTTDPPAPVAPPIGVMPGAAPKAVAAIPAPPVPASAVEGALSGPAPQPTRSPAAPSRAPTPAPSPVSALPVPPEPKPARAAEARIEELIDRASALRRERPDRLAELDALIAEASEWLGSKDEAKAASAGDALERRLAQLER